MPIVVGASRVAGVVHEDVDRARRRSMAAVTAA